MLNFHLTYKWSTLAVIMITLFSCSSDNEELKLCLSIDIKPDDIQIVEDFQPNCDDFNDSRIVLSASFDYKQEVVKYEWMIDGVLSTNATVEIKGLSVKEGYVVIYFDLCKVIKNFSIVPEFPEENTTSISGITWRDSRYFEGGDANIFDETDYGSGPMVVELLDGETLEVIKVDTTDENENFTYLFDNLHEGRYVVKFNEIETSNTFVWLKQNYSERDQEYDSDVNEFGFTDPFFLETCTEIDNINAGFRICFSGDEDCLNEEDCTYFVKREDVIIEQVFMGCGGTLYPRVRLSVTSPQDAYLDLFHGIGDVGSSSFSSSISFTATVPIRTFEINIFSDKCSFSDSFDIEFTVPSSSIGGVVWIDEGLNDNMLDGDDRFVEGFTVQLYGDNKSEVLQSTRTDTLGAYNFGQILPGNYYVKFVNEDNSLEYVDEGVGSISESSDVVDQDGFSYQIDLEQCTVLEISAGLR